MSNSKDMTKEDAYKCLGLTEGATKAEIQKAFRTLAKQYHPDRFGPLGKDAVKASHVIFVRLQAAYDLLMAV